jgi:hypothetical protein
LDRRLVDVGHVENRGGGIRVEGAAIRSCGREPEKLLGIGEVYEVSQV